MIKVAMHEIALPYRAKITHAIYPIACLTNPFARWQAAIRFQNERETA